MKTQTGLKPAGLDEGPVVPRAEEALEQGSPKEVVDFLSGIVKDNLAERLAKALAKEDYDVTHLYKFIESGDTHNEGDKHREEAA